MPSIVPKSPILEKGHFHLVQTRPRACGTPSGKWRSILRWTIITCSLTYLIVFVSLSQATVGPRLLYQIMMYRLVKGFSPLDPTILDVTKSRQHKTTIRPSMTYEVHNLEASGVFAEWYGNPSQVGPSPFDYAIPPEWQTSLSGRKRWLVSSGGSCNKQNDNELCDLAAALETSSGRSIQHVGSVGTSVPITDVLLRHAEAAASAGPSNVKLDIRLLNECAGHNCTGQLDVSHGGITLVRHAFELIDFFEYAKLKAMYGSFDMQLFGHLPYAADPARFYPENQWEHKTVEYLDVDGVLSTKVRENLPLPEDYRKAKLCVFSSTPKKGMSREWIKAMLSGCVIVSDMPSESEEILEEAIIRYDASASATVSQTSSKKGFPDEYGIQDIEVIIDETSKDPASLKKKALRAFIHARRWHTPSYQAGYILQLSELHRAGERGYDFPMPFAAVCRVYPDGTKPSWC